MFHGHSNMIVSEKSGGCTGIPYATVHANNMEAERKARKKSYGPRVTGLELLCGSVGDRLTAARRQAVMGDAGEVCDIHVQGGGCWADPNREGVI